MSDKSRQPASFRDPSGFLFWHNDSLYRQINASYQKDFDQLIESGLYQTLLERGWLIPHQDAAIDIPADDRAYKIIQPSHLEFISYPFEWSFSQLKDAALLTLKIQQLAMKHGMSLKDSSAYNIQFQVGTGKPILIDTLSFEIYAEGKPWVAYRQFCQHFLAPLVLMAHTDIRLSQLSRVYIDGIPLDLASSLLPKKTYLNFGTLTHIHLHAKAQQRFAGAETDALKTSSRQMSETALYGLVDSLKRTIEKLTWGAVGTDWGQYYNCTNYSDESMTHKAKLVADFTNQASPEIVWDLGANTGQFSRIASHKGIQTIAFDIDPAAVEKNYLTIKERNETHLLPLLIDLVNPSPNIGWANKERSSLPDRANADLVYALALIHHLAISNNLPLAMIAEYFCELTEWLIIEFVPKADSQVQRLLSSREDIFENYTQSGFMKAFEHYYDIKAAQDIRASERRLYLMKRK
ncbi:MAG: class I SAM-dependent methyltransferase [Chloroflexota bacterium]|nr:class I SAM-dependent methyltransferase [Chloroflexota bacterium]